MSKKRPNDHYIFLLLVAAQVLFGVHYIASKVLLAHFPPLVWASLRSLSAALLFVLITAAIRKLDAKKAIKLALPLVLFALLSTCLNQAFFLSGLQLTTTAGSRIRSLSQSRPM